MAGTTSLVKLTQGCLIVNQKTTHKTYKHANRGQKLAVSRSMLLKGSPGRSTVGGFVPTEAIVSTGVK